MSHNVEYFTYPENTHRGHIEADLNNYVAHADWQEGCSGLANPIRWHGEIVCDSEEDARVKISKMDKGWYDQIAVKFIQRENPHDKKVSELIEKRKAACDEYRNRDNIKYAETVTSALITCKKCGSKLARTYLKANCCPVCRNELRPEHMLKSVEAAKNRWDRASRDVEEYIRKHGKKEVWWLVKIEYHT